MYWWSEEVSITRRTTTVQHNDYKHSYVKIIALIMNYTALGTQLSFIIIIIDTQRLLLNGESQWQIIVTTSNNSPIHDTQQTKCTIDIYNITLCNSE
jgi:hypothetical protein